MTMTEGPGSERYGLATLSPDAEKAAHAAFAARALIGREPWDACLDIRLRISVFVPMPQMSLQALLELKAGGLVEAGWPSSQDVPLLVEDVLLANGELEPVGERLGVRINGFAEQPRQLGAALGHRNPAAAGLRGPSAARSEAHSVADPAEGRRLCTMDDLMVHPVLRFGGMAMPLREVLALCVGDIVILDRPVVAPVTMIAGGRVVAEGDLVLAGSSYAIRIHRVAEMAPHLPEDDSPF